MKYLDYAGLETLVSQIKSKYTLKTDVPSNQITYSLGGTHDTVQLTDSNGDTTQFTISDVNHAEQANSAISATYDSENNKIISTYLKITSAESKYATKDEISALTSALVYKGTLGTNGTVTTLPTSGVKIGDVYVAIAGAPAVGGMALEPGDMVIAQSTTPTWTVVQTNINGAVTSDANITGGALVIGAKDGTKQIKGFTTTSGGFVKVAATGVVSVDTNQYLTSSTVPAATTGVIGGFKLYSATAQSVGPNSVSATASRTYAVQLNSSNQAVVNVPWVNTTYSLPTATSSVLGGIKLGSDTKQTIDAGTPSSTSGRSYAVQLDNSGKAVVNVPWTDNNTTYSADGTYVTLSGTQFSLTSAKKSLIDNSIQNSNLDGSRDSHGYYAYPVSQGSDKNLYATVPVRSFIAASRYDNTDGSKTPSGSITNTTGALVFLYRTINSTTGVMTGVLAQTSTAIIGAPFYNTSLTEAYHQTPVHSLIINIAENEYTVTATSEGSIFDGNLLTLTPVAIQNTEITSLF